MPRAPIHQTPTSAQQPTGSSTPFGQFPPLQGYLLATALASTKALVRLLKLSSGPRLLQLAHREDATDTWSAVGSISLVSASHHSPTFEVQTSTLNHT
jgi:hypothetical protein